MPTIFSHAAVPLAIGLGLGRARLPTALVTTGVMMSMLPDLDVVGLRLGVVYEDAFGHRGASHALATAALVGGLVGIAVRWRLASSACAMLFLFVAMASHGLLDGMTNGGHGVALLWPVSDDRFFSPFHPIQVSPLSLRRFLSSQGVAVLASEIVWVWLPCMAFGFVLRFGFRTRRQAVAPRLGPR